MLTFEISVIDIVLLISIIILAVLHISKASAQTANLPEVDTRKKIEDNENASVKSKGSKNKGKCPYFLGYLSKNKRAKIPDECFTCLQMSLCLGRDMEAHA